MRIAINIRMADNRVFIVNFQVIPEVTRLQTYQKAVLHCKLERLPSLSKKADERRGTGEAERWRDVQEPPGGRRSQKAVRK